MALRGKYRPRETLPIASMAKSSCEYASKVRAKGGSEEHAATRKAVIAAFEESGGAYDCRRITAMVGAGERRVRAITKEESLIASAARKKRRHSSYGGEISSAPPNLLRDEWGKHRFRAERPSEKWMTDVTEFRIPAGKACLSPVVDCLDGMPPGWPVSASPDAEMANTSLLNACERLDEGGHPEVRPGRGRHCRQPGWIRICDEEGLTRSMPWKGRSPDDAGCEGFVGRLKIESLYGRDRSGAGIEEFIGMPDAYLKRYGGIRIKSDLDYRSPMQYRRGLGLAAQDACGPRSPPQSTLV